jgi:serine/threonine-protein kinase
MPIRLEMVQSTLADRFEVERRIGRGGMAAVFLARRLSDGETVAVKVFDPLFQATKWATRFRNEITVLKSLDHPNIQPLLETGRAGNLFYYEMPYADGGSLDRRIAQRRTFGFEETIEITTPIAAALDYAHDRNVLHRDVKPGNILFHEELPLLCDFGIARAIQRAGGDQLTSLGVRIGSPPYMSPEQARADQDLDGRSDVYALACVAFELLVGEPPFTGLDRNVIAKHIGEPPPQVLITRPDLPAHVDDAVHRGLAKQPDEQPPTAKDFASQLAGES